MEGGCAERRPVAMRVKTKSSNHFSIRAINIANAKPKGFEHASAMGLRGQRENGAIKWGGNEIEVFSHDLVAITAESLVASWAMMGRLGTAFRSDPRRLRLTIQRPP